MDATSTVVGMEQFHRDGYTVFRGVEPGWLLDDAEKLLDDLEESWNAELEGLPGKRSWISQAGEITFTARLAGNQPKLASLIQTPTLRGFLSAVLGGKVRLYFDQAVYKRPECTQVVPWHQDNAYNPKRPAEYITFWIPLCDTSEDNGTIRLQPARHREGSLKHWRTSDGYIVCEEDAGGGVPLELCRGDVVAFSSLLPHATGPNSTLGTRKAYMASVTRDGTRLLDGSPCDDPITQPLLDVGA